MTDKLVLTGDINNVSQELSDSEVNHLRRLLAWISLEHHMEDEMLAGIMIGAHKIVEANPASLPRAQEVVDEYAAKARSAPAYIRHAVKMLTKAVRDHDDRTRVVHHEGQTLEGA